jgi:hypothetical protein
MRKLFWLLAIITLAACKQLQNAEMQPVLTKSAKDEIYSTTCAGAVEDWASCYDKASKTCQKNYIVLSKLDNSRGTTREITFQCKK